MKKIASLFMFLLVCSFMSLVINVNANAQIEADCGESHYEVSELVESNTLKAGVTHDRYISYSSSGLEGFNAAGSGGGGLNVPDQLYPQQVNVLNVPTNTGVRIVNWVKHSNYGWARGTVKEMARDFEVNNPGWIVIAAVNGDFFDIKSNNPLPETANGSIIENGDVLKTVGSTVIGFTNGNEERSLVGGTPISFTDYFILSLYDENGKIVKEYQIDNVNPTTSVSGLSLYYSYPSIVSGEGATAIREYSKATIPTTGFISTLPERCIPYSGGEDGSFFGKGKVEECTADTEIKYTQFGVYTDDEQVAEEIAAASKIRVQRNAIGEYANCDNVSGTGETLVENGAPVVYNDKNRHPRTMIGVKEDGTLVLVTVDGRQPNTEMYGMTTDEMSALMYAHGCQYAYNMDGGGSTTILIREEGELVVKNSPSDGNERRDANAILIVIPEIELNVSDVTDSSITINAPKALNDIKVENIKVSIDNKEYDLTDSLNIEDLESKKEYTINYSYDRTYNGKTEKINGDPIVVKTGKIIPSVNKLEYIYNQTNQTLTLKIDINDPDSTVTLMRLTNGSEKIKVDAGTTELVLENIRSFDASKLSLVVLYDIETAVNSAGSINCESSSFTDITPQHVHTPCPTCGLCTLPDCDGLDLNKCQGHESEDKPSSGNGCNFGVYVSTMLIATIGLAYVIIKKK